MLKMYSRLLLSFHQLSPQDNASTAPPKPPPPLNVPVEQVDSVEDSKKDKSDILYTSTNYVNAIVGSGVIGEH